MNLVPVNITFPEFWEVCPRKTGDKPRAEKLFNKLSDVNKFNAYQGMIYHAKNNPQWRNKSLIPHPTTYLSQERWNDEIVEDKGSKERVIEKTGNLVDMVWSAMTQMFGETWIKKHGEDPPLLWRQLLKGIPEDRIKRGLRTCYQVGSDFPPSLPKFAEYCAKTFGEANEFPALPHSVTDTETALSHLAEIKKSLRHG